MEPGKERATKKRKRKDQKEVTRRWQEELEEREKCGDLRNRGRDRNYIAKMMI